MKIKILMLIFCSFFSTVSSQLSNELIWSTGTFYPKNINGINPYNDGDFYTSIERNNGQTEIVKYSYKKNKKIATLFSNLSFENFSFSDYDVSKDGNWLLLFNSKESIYRRSSKSYYYLYNLKEKTLKSLADTSLGKQRLATFSPDNSKIAYVRNNNLYYKNLDDFKEEKITHNGSINKIINGATDWVYEEEFSIHKGFFWSPDGSKIAYYVFNEEHVKQFEMEIYDNLYPSQYRFKYPKAGEQNSSLAIKVFDLDNIRTYNFDIGKEQDIYIPRIMWSKRENELIVFKMNRLQNKLELLSGNINNKVNPNSEIIVQNIYSEVSETYIDIHDNTVFINENQFLWTSEKDGYNHLYLIDYKAKKEIQLTSGKWEVTKMYGYSANEKTIFFQAAKKTPTDREVYSLNIDSKKIQLLSNSSGTNDASFSSNYNYFINTHSDANNPFIRTLNDNKGKLLKVLEDNKSLLNKMNDFDLVEKIFFSIPNDNNIDLNAWIMKPELLDTNKKHPLLIYVYGGPGINTVNNAWSWMNYFWFQYLVKQGFVVVSVDNRGTGYRGKEFKHATYLQLGKLETEDQIDAAIHMGKLNYIDKDRIGIFGWSYGGYMSSLCISKGADVFNSAIAVAPVTNWRYYDNIYTERFMRTPKENGDNYDINSPINHVRKIKGNYLLIHGTADDNVHFQNSMEMVNSLVKENKEFDFFAYPNKNHGISGGYTRLHLYNKMTNFLFENLLND
ncbi:MAG: S9 family peptidase [Bacteroidetes bacterium MED-G20]|nr:MAG: S9 family peptidase [Bacteroidetes bacterium MED-G20]